jgi:tight adherence protein B
VSALAVALVAAYGAHLFYTGLVFRWRGVGPGPTTGAVRPRTLHRRLTDGAEWLSPELVAVSGAVAVVGALLAWAVFGGILPPLVAAVATGTTPALGRRAAVARRRAVAAESWPRLIEEVRIRATTAGRSVPQALFDVGMSGPRELRPAFDEARREWLLSTDFDRTLAVLRRRLADPTADVVCETLLVAHQVGGTDVGRTLAALVDDRTADLQGRKDAASRQAGARFARGFTLVVPIAMALIGMGMGTGRAAYGTPTGQVLVAFGLAVMVGCWVWAGRVMRLPAERRVFADGAG